MATTQAQVDQAIAEIEAIKPLADNKPDSKSVYAVLKKYRAAYALKGHNGYQDNEFGDAIQAAAFKKMGYPGF